MKSSSKADSLRSFAKEQESFSEIVKRIDSTREKVVRTINTGLIDLYWEIGHVISRKIEAAKWGDGVVEQLAEFIARTQPGLRGSLAQILFRMRQFYDTYRSDERVAPLARQLSWSHNLVILGQGKRAEEREFYLRMAIGEQWSRRELER